MQTLRSRLILSHILPLLLVLPYTVALLYLLETQVLLTSLSHVPRNSDPLGEAVRRQVEVSGRPREAQAFVAGLAVSLDGRVLLLRLTAGLAAAGRAATAARSRLSLPASATALQGQTSVLVTTAWPGRGPRCSCQSAMARQVVGIVGVIQTLRGVDRWSAGCAG